MTILWEELCGCVRTGQEASKVDFVQHSEGLFGAFWIGSTITGFAGKHNIFQNRNFGDSLLNP